MGGRSCSIYGCSKLIRLQDPAQAEALLGQLSLRNIPDVSMQPSAGLDASMAVDSSTVQQPHYGTNAPSVGTPIKLAPSAAAFRRTTGSADKAPQPSQPGLTSSRSWIPGGAGVGGGAIPSSTWSGNAGTGPTVPTGVAMAGKIDASQNRGMLGHVSDLIFGW